ncbi:MAG: xanthine dehydrogenase family protein molybdopterin-binding subunit, partial [Pseudonocardia sp.]|nr:xanthine dehydrogenase family protein molybdopterin-binding subunit [Pseudonocardia sp.]
MTETLQARAIGRGLSRRDGPAKVTGAATYAYETHVAHPVYCSPVQASIPRGRIASVDTGELQGLDGVLATLTPEHAERLASAEDAELAVLQDVDVGFR